GRGASAADRRVGIQTEKFGRTARAETKRSRRAGRGIPSEAGGRLPAAARRQARRGDRSDQSGAVFGLPYAGLSQPGQRGQARTGDQFLRTLPADRLFGRSRNTCERASRRASEQGTSGLLM